MPDDGQKRGESFEELLREGVVPEGAGRTGGEEDPCIGPVLPPFSEDECEQARGGMLRLLDEWGGSPQELRELRSAKIPPGEGLDVHGLTAREAHGEVDRHLRAALASGRRVIEICHGKGGHSPDGIGVLRALVRHWLSNCGAVLAFTTFGNNAGSVRVRLRSLSRMRR